MADSGVYSVTVSVNGCVSQPGNVVVDIDALPALPGVADVEYCLGDTSPVPLTATGNGLVWYTVQTGGTPLPGAPTPNTSTPGTTTWYVAATGPGPTFCEGNRAAIDVTVHPLTELPDIDYIPYYCPGDVFIPFAVVIGQNIQYYTTAVGGTGSTVAPVIDPNIPGTYSYFASQTVNGCESGRIPITVIVWPLVDAVYSYEIKYGCTEDTVVFTNTSIGANKYKWYFGDGTTDTASNPVHIFGTQGVYTVKLVSKSNTCKDSLEQVIDLQHPLAAGFTTDVDTICQHRAITFTNTSVTTTINGIPPTYSWNFGDGFTDVTDNPVHTFDVTGVYTVFMVVKDFVPCTDTAFRTVYVDTTSAFSLAVSDSMACAGQAITFSGNYSEIGLKDIMWEYGDGIVEHNVNPARHSYEQPGSYIIKVSADYRICRDTSAEIPVVLRPRPIINLGPDTSMCPNAEPLVLTDYLNGGNASASWQWNTGEQTFTILAKQPGMYSATVTIDGCSGTDSVWVKKDCYLDVPNSFTPNGDGMNDYFLPRQLLSESVKTFKMTIYNRWGQEIYQTTKLDGRGWDGYFNGQPQPQGVFVYVIDVSFSNGHKEQYKGNVTLLK
jgi:gliding motility-associated-like protein